MAARARRACSRSVDALSTRGNHHEYPNRLDGRTLAAGVRGLYLHRHVAALHPDRHQDLRPGQDGQLSGGRLRVSAAMVATALPGLILPH